MTRKFITTVGVVSLFVTPLVGIAVTTLPSTGAIACTMDAKMCPDGSYVGRSGPNCEFVCPTESKPATPALPTLKKGVTNDRVKDIQAILKSDPTIYTGPITGYYGAMTEEAIKKVQAKYGLPQTGTVDDATQNILIPYDTNVDVRIVTPNGGETWKTGETVKITWTATFGPRPCLQRPACLDSIPRCLPAEPAGGWCPPNNSLPVPSTTSGASGTYREGSASGSVNGADVSVSSAPSGVATPSIMPVQPAPAPFFPRATLTLLRDSDPSFVRTIGTVNLYESGRTWTVPRSIPEAKDYRVQISVGGVTPCLYRAETEARAAGKALDAGMVYPCPMMDAGTTNSSVVLSPMYYPNFSSSDVSDNIFTILGGGADDVEALKRRLAEAEALLAKLAAEVAAIRAAIGQM